MYGLLNLRSIAFLKGEKTSIHKIIIIFKLHSGSYVLNYDNSEKKTRFQNTNSTNVISNGYVVVPIYLLLIHTYCIGTGIYYYTILHDAANDDRLQLQFIIILHARIYTYLHSLTSIKIQYILFAAIKTLEFVLYIAKCKKINK